MPCHRCHKTQRLPPSMTLYAYDVDPNVPTAPPVNLAASPPMVLLYDGLIILRAIATLPFVFIPRPLAGIDITFDGLALQVVAFIVSLGVSGMILAALGIGVPTPWIAFVLAWIALAVIKLVQGEAIIPPRVGSNEYDKEAWFV